MCGCSAPAVKCEQCANQTFCFSCDEMYHRHPKRQAHNRKVIYFNTFFQYLTTLLIIFNMFTIPDNCKNVFKIKNNYKFEICYKFLANIQKSIPEVYSFRFLHKQRIWVINKYVSSLKCIIP